MRYNPHTASSKDRTFRLLHWDAQPSDCFNSEAGKISAAQSRTKPWYQPQSVFTSLFFPYKHHEMIVQLAFYWVSFESFQYCLSYFCRAKSRYLPNQMRRFESSPLIFQLDANAYFSPILGSSILLYTYSNSHTYTSVQYLVTLFTHINTRMVAINRYPALAQSNVQVLSGTQDFSVKANLALN
jgi:hypothetical protein